MNLFSYRVSNVYSAGDIIFMAQCLKWEAMWHKCKVRVLSLMRSRVRLCQRTSDEQNPNPNKLMLGEKKLSPWFLLRQKEQLATNSLARCFLALLYCYHIQYVRTPSPNDRVSQKFHIMSNYSMGMITLSHPIFLQKGSRLLKHLNPYSIFD